jgi:hypothetical protein
LLAGRVKSGRDSTTVQQSAALQLHEIARYPDWVADHFHEPILKNGISRMILPGANRTEEDESNEISL